MRKTGPDTSTRLQVLQRASYRCERCNEALTDAVSLHHRRPRRMGGTRKPDSNSPANLLVLCGTGTTGCHGWIESHRLEGYENGIILYDRDNPTEHPYQDNNQNWWTLHTDGTKAPGTNPSSITTNTHPRKDAQ